MSRSTDTRNPNFAIMIICEGKRTEPNFFYCLCKDLKERGILTCKYAILPKSSFEKEDEETNADRGDRKRVVRELNKGKVISPDANELFPGEQPLNWVKAGLGYLDTYNEVWCVFDKDGHPKQKEAFALVDKNRKEGKNINIAFSSRCIEYYFLIHFEYLYKAFEKSECNEKQYKGKKSKTVYFNCMTSEAVPGKACDGSLCVNGYARMKGYWKESKTDISLYPALRKKLYMGIRNAFKVREESYRNDTYSPIYERNPFVTTDNLVARLLGSHIIGGNRHEFSVNGTTLNITFDNAELKILNSGKISYVIDKAGIESLNIETEKTIPLCNSLRILEPGQEISISLKTEDKYITRLNLGNDHYLLEKY